MKEERKRYIPEFKDIPSARAKRVTLPVEKRIKDFSEVEAVLEKEAAIREAKRCLSCRRCLGCKLCLAVCEPKAIEFGQEEELIELTFDNLVIAPGMERRITPLREELGYGKFPNVVNGVEFEAILRSDGPYGGIILRPWDGEIPRTIAFIAEDKQALIYTLKEIKIAERQFPQIKLVIFTTAEFDLEVPERYEYRKGKVLAVKEKEDHNLLIQWQDSEKISEEEFEMVVAQSPLTLAPEVLNVINQLNIVPPAPFWETLDIESKETGKERVYFTGGINKRD